MSLTERTNLSIYDEILEFLSKTVLCDHENVSGQPWTVHMMKTINAAE